MTDFPAAQSTAYTAGHGPSRVAPRDVQAGFASIVVDEWLRAGVTDAVACPGSRSTPLLVALAEASERGALCLHVVVDERTAGFVALGLGLGSGTPAPVVTTSGTAAAELHPAIVEAHHAGVPMVAVTADRPEELHDCGAPQTVRQVGLYGDALRWSAAIGVPALASSSSWRSLASRSVAEARGGAHGPGPVHLNLAFREPLVGSVQAFASNVGAALGPRSVQVLNGRPGRAPWHRLSGPEELPVPPGCVELLVDAGERGLIVAGRGAGSAGAVWELSRATGWPVLADPTSACRLPGAIAAADALLRTELVRQWRPDVVLRLGAPWASKVLNGWLGELECSQVLVDRWGAWASPDRLPGDVVVGSPEALCRAVAERSCIGGGGAWARQWALAESVAQGAIDAMLADESGLSEPGIARVFLGSVPTGSTVFVSSSMPVRDVEWWTKPREDVRVLANRGANGIDGVLASALGVAASLRKLGRLGSGPQGSGHIGGAGERVSVLLGDLAFLYDVGSLLGVANHGVCLDLVVIDNNGGGIFNSLTPLGHQPAERFERLWGVPHGLDLCAVASSYGVEAETISDLAGLASAMALPGEHDGVRAYVLRTDRAAGVGVRRRLNAGVEAAVQAAAAAALEAAVEAAEMGRSS